MNRLFLPVFASIVASFACLVVALPVAAGPFAYVANKDSDDVSIVDVATATEMERLPVVDKPKGVATNASRTNWLRFRRTSSPRSTAPCWSDR